MKLIAVSDASTQFCCTTLSNRNICLVIASCQLVISAASLAQHIVSLVRFGHIFLCRFDQSKLLPEQQSTFLSADIIIFDFGLFNKLINVEECIANYLDGGYMRCLWCLGQIVAILLLFVVPTLRNPHPVLIWPMLLMENCYVLGLLILTLASLNKFLTVVLTKLTWSLFQQVFVYFAGSLTNFFLNYILWHYYWHLEERHKNGWVLPVEV